MIFLKWEYKVVPVTMKVQIERYVAYKAGQKPIIDSIQDVLNILGEDGWELVCTDLYRGNVVAYFKRQKNE